MQVDPAGAELPGGIFYPHRLLPLDGRAASRRPLTSAVDDFGKATETLLSIENRGEERALWLVVGTVAHERHQVHNQ